MLGRFVFLSAVLLSFTASLGAQALTDYVGTWRGKIEAVDLEFSITIVEKDKTLAGTVSIPAQGLKDHDLESMKLDGDQWQATVPGAPGNPTFKGQLDDAKTTIAGSFTQGEGKTTFSMSREGTKKAKSAKEKLDGLSEWLNDALSAFDVPGVSVVVVHKGEVIFQEGAGYRDFNAQKPVTKETLFSIGSSTKAFTTFGLATLVQEEKIEWDKPVISYLPDLDLHDDTVERRISLRDMVSHRSGLPRHDLVWYNAHDLSLEGIFKRLHALEPSADLREKFQYNNLMYATAGYVASRMDGRSWPALMKARVTDPLGMKSTVYCIAEAVKADDHALPYDFRDERITRIPFREIANIGPAGSISSNAIDMARWLLVFQGQGRLDDQEILSKEAFFPLVTPTMPMGDAPRSKTVGPKSYGLGWMIDTYRGDLRLHHGGNIDGFSALVTHFPFKKTGICVLCNMNGTGLTSIIEREIADRLFGHDDRSWFERAKKQHKLMRNQLKESEGLKGLGRKEGTQPAHALADYAGRYRHGGYGEVLVSCNDKKGTLSFLYNGIRTELEHWHFETFSGIKNPTDPTFDGFKLLFQTNVEGEVAMLSLAMDASVSRVLFKKAADESLKNPDYLAQFIGDFELPGALAKVRVAKSKLQVSLPGQPTYDLIPASNDEFRLDGMDGFSVLFQRDAKDVVEALVFRQPNGNFRAVKAVEKGETTYDVVIKSFGENKIGVIKALRSLTGLGLKEAKDLVESAPATIGKGLSKKEATSMADQLGEAGAIVKVEATAKPEGN